MLTVTLELSFAHKFQLHPLIACCNTCVCCDSSQITQVTRPGFAYEEVETNLEFSCGLRRMKTYRFVDNEDDDNDIYWKSSITK